MKVFFKDGSNRYPKGGKKDGIIFCYYRQRDLCVGRKYITIPLLPQNAKIITLEKVTLDIWHKLPLRFKHDLVVYTKQYKVQYPDLRRKHLNSYGIFLKIIHRIDKDYQLSQRDDASFELYVQMFGLYSTADFIKAGYLLPVKDGSKLTARIISQEHELPVLQDLVFSESNWVYLVRLCKPG